MSFGPNHSGPAVAGRGAAMGHGDFVGSDRDWHLGIVRDDADLSPALSARHLVDGGFGVGLDGHAIPADLAHASRPV